MVIENWVSLLLRHTASFGPVTWDDVVVGHDFGFLTPHAIQSWAQTLPTKTPQVDRLVALADQELLGLEACLWAACTEASGHPPRPGGRRWARSQDRWRLALIKEALEDACTKDTLGTRVEEIYERVGCPEDMLGLWHISPAWRPCATRPHFEAIQRFIQRLERQVALVS